MINICLDSLESKSVKLANKNNVFLIEFYSLFSELKYITSYISPVELVRQIGLKHFSPNCVISKAKPS
jgi:hypothetical protein